MEKDKKFFENILSEEEIKEYYDLKQKQDDVSLYMISLLVEELLRNMKKDNFKEEITIKINNLIYKISSRINNCFDKELEDVTEISLYINKIEKKCLSILKRVLKNNFKEGINNNISDIYLCLVCLDSIQISIYKIQNNMLKRNEYYNKFDIQFNYYSDYNKDKESAEEVYDYVKKIAMQQKN